MNFNKTVFLKKVADIGTAVAVQAAALAVSTAVVTVVNKKVMEFLNRNKGEKSCKEDKCCK